MNILVVDDSQEFRTIMQVVLSSAGYDDVRFATSGQDALAKLGVEPQSLDAELPDIILLDVLMPPGIDGIETCVRIRGDHRYHDVPILMVTAEADMEALSHAFIAGANDYITKPINRTALIARIRSALKLKAELDRRVHREKELEELLRGQRGGATGRAGHVSILDEVTGLLKGEIVDLAIHGLNELSAPPWFGILAIVVDERAAFDEYYGQISGQDMFGKVARTIGRVPSRLFSIVGSYGNLIAVMVPDMEIAEAEALARSILAAVEELSIPHAESQTANRVTVSCGITPPTPPENLRSALAQALHTANQASLRKGNDIAFVRMGT